MQQSLSAAEIYRVEARRARDLAAATEDTAERRMLERIAEQYEELAAKVEGHPSLAW